MTAGAWRGCRGKARGDGGDQLGRLTTRMAVDYASKGSRLDRNCFEEMGRAGLEGVP